MEYFYPSLYVAIEFGLYLLSIMRAWRAVSEDTKNVFFFDSSDLPFSVLYSTLIFSSVLFLSSFPLLSRILENHFSLMFEVDIF